MFTWVLDRVGECVGAGKRKLQRYSYSDHVPMMVSHAESDTVQLRTKSSVIMLRHLFAVFVASKGTGVDTWNVVSTSNISVAMGSILAMTPNSS